MTKYVTKALAGSQIGLREDGTRARPNRVRYSRGFFGAPVAALRQYLHDGYEDKKRDAGEEVIELAGPWILQESAPLPRDFRGRVDRAAAEAQFLRDLERSTEVKLLDGRIRRGNVVLGMPNEHVTK